MRTKLFLTLAVVTVLALVLAACGPTPTEAPAAPTPTTEAATEEAPPTEVPATEPVTEEPVTIQVMVVDYIPDVTDTWLEEEVVPAFQEEYPNVSVEFVYVNWGTLDETVQGYFAAEEGADIINLGSEYVAEYGDRLAPLNSYMDEWGELEQFVPATLDTVTWDGEVRGLPWLTAPRAIMCRTDILSEAGIDKAPTTFEEALQVAADTTVIENNALVRQGYIGGVGLNDWQEYVDLIWSLGGQIYHEDGTPAFDTPEAKAALQFMYDRRRAVLPDDTIAGLPEATGSRLATDEVGCQWSNLWGAPPTDDPIWDNIELSPGLTDPAFGAEPVVQVFNDWLAIPAYSQHLPEAVAFLQFLGSAENLNKYNEGFGSFPPRKDAWTGFVENPVMQEMGQLMDEYGMGFADVRETAQFRDILVAEIDAFFADLQDIDTALYNIQSNYGQVLEDAGRIAAFEPPAKPEKEPVTIQVMLVDYIPDVTDTWLEEEVVPAFQEEYPNVSVEFVYVNWGTLDETVQGYFAAGEGADIINLGSEYVAEYGDRLAALNTYMDKWGELDQFVPASLDTVTWDGEVRGLPWLTAPRAVMCRVDILSEAGIDKAPTTFEEGLQVAKDTTVIENNALVRQGYIGGVGLNDWQEYVDLIWSLGGQIYHEDGTPAFDTPEAKAALQFMYDRRRAVLPDDTIAGLPEATGSRLATDEVGCQWSNLWGAPPTDDPIWDKIELSPGLTDPAFNAEPVVQVFNDWLAIPAYSQHLPEAVAFLQFLGSAENLNKYNEGFGSFPPRKDAWTGFVENPIMQEMGQLMDEYGMGFADVRETAQFRDILVAEIDAYFADLQDIDTALQNIQDNYTQVLQEAGRIP